MRLQTLHFTGEPLSEDHFDELVRMHRDARVMAHLGGVRDDIQTRSYLDFNLAHWKAHGFGLWVVRDRRDDRIAGRAVLRHLDIEGADEMEIGYALYPEWWGRGLATEIARELVRLGFAELECRSLVAITRPGNLGSRHVLEKAGLSYDGDITHDGIQLALYRIARSG